MSLSIRRVGRVLAVAGVAYLSFALGFWASRQLKLPPYAEVRRDYLQGGGDSPPAVRLPVLDSLRAFQQGYVKRDPAQLDAFMSRLFAKDDDILLMGTDSNEWRRGYDNVADFIKEDWLHWGDLRFNVDESLVWSSGDVAWTASIGTVRNSRGRRPMRFATILSRNGGKWVFRQLHFQWDEREPNTSDLLHPQTQARVVGLVCDRVRLKILFLFTSRRP